MNKEIMTTIQRLLDSRIDTVGDNAKPKSLVETFWLNELGKIMDRDYASQEQP